MTSSLKLLCPPFTSNSSPSPVDFAPTFLCRLPSSLLLHHCSGPSSSFILSCPDDCIGFPPGLTTSLLHFYLNFRSQNDFNKMQIWSVFHCPKLSTMAYKILFGLTSSILSNGSLFTPLPSKLWVSFLSFFLWQNIRNKIYHFEMYSSVTFSTFTLLCSHHHHPFVELFHLPQLKFCAY